MDLQLKGKRAVVAGGSRGIGRAIARALVDEGVRVAIGARDGDAVRAAAAALSAGGGEVHGLTLDTRDDAAVDNFIARAVELLGGIDIVVNAAADPAGILAVSGIEGLTSDEILTQVDTKIIGYVRVARAAAPYLIANGWGRIINISGLGARFASSIVGSVRNAGVVAFSKAMADELGAHGINVTVVHPGHTRTERTADSIASRAAQDGISLEEAERALYGGSLIGRIVDAHEVADVVAFLASPRSIAITGDAIAVGGGVRGAIHY